MPDAPWDETQFVGLSQLYAKAARIFDEDGVEFFERGSVSWSETNVVQATARRRGARAYYLLDERALAERVRERTVAELVAAAPAEAVVPLEDLPFAAPAGSGGGGPGDRLDHAHDRRPPRRRACACAG